MPVIPFDPTVYYFKNTPPHINTDSHHYLLAIQSDLIRFRTGEHDPLRAAELRKITTRLSAALARFEPPQGAA
jgi:hypothetical protein